MSNNNRHEGMIGSFALDANGRSDNMGFSKTSYFVTYINVGHFNEGVMKTTNFNCPEHGTVTYQTLDELKAVAQNWKMYIRLD